MLNVSVCAECECRGGHCDPRTGECRCPDGMTGKQCDSCTHRYSVPVHHQHGMHCERRWNTHTHSHTLTHATATEWKHSLCFKNNHKLSTRKNNLTLFKNEIKCLCVCVRVCVCFWMCVCVCVCVPCSVWQLCHRPVGGSGQIEPQLPLGSGSAEQSQRQLHGLGSAERPQPDCGGHRCEYTHTHTRTHCTTGIKLIFPWFQRAIENYNSTLDDSRSRADMLEAEITNINDDINELQDKVTSLFSHTHTHTLERSKLLIFFVLILFLYN